MCWGDGLETWQFLLVSGTMNLWSISFLHGSWHSEQNCVCSPCFAHSTCSSVLGQCLSLNFISQDFRWFPEMIKKFSLPCPFTCLGRTGQTYFYLSFPPPKPSKVRCWIAWNGGWRGWRFQTGWLGCLVHKPALGLEREVSQAWTVRWTYVFMSAERGRGIMLTVGWRSGVDSGCRLAGSSNITNDVTIRHFQS